MAHCRSCLSWMRKRAGRAGSGARAGAGAGAEDLVALLPELPRLLLVRSLRHLSDGDDRVDRRSSSSYILLGQIAAKKLADLLVKVVFPLPHQLRIKTFPEAHNHHVLVDISHVNVYRADLESCLCGCNLVPSVDEHVVGENQLVGGRNTLLEPGACRLIVPSSLQFILNVWKRSDDPADLLHLNFAALLTRDEHVEDGGAWKFSKSCADLMHRVCLVDKRELPVSRDRLGDRLFRAEVGDLVDCVGHFLQVSFLGLDLIKNLVQERVGLHLPLLLLLLLLLSHLLLHLRPLLPCHVLVRHHHRCPRSSS
mmetsp:Transcript_27526/g.89657  ORF Transcript_27526/g.89657 Transcript_27526/m.89657 type:complete len:310 (-) Transcript_27526:165-1094(-)